MNKGISSITQNLVWTLAVTVSLSGGGAGAEETKPAHNLAEGDNPALNEKALQGEELSKTAAGQDASSEAGSVTPHWSELSSTVEKLVREYFPKAKLKPGMEQMHVEYKAKPFILPSTNKEEQGPDWGGIVFDMELKKGPYAGVHQVPKKFNEYSFYSVELFAPYSKKFDSHLLTRICYPFDVPPEFLKRFKKVVEDFEQYL